MSFTLGLQCPHDAAGNCTCKTIGLGRLSLFTAAEYGLVDAVQAVLISDRAKANALDPYGYTALHYAAQRNHVDVVKLLLKFGAKVDGGTCGATALHRAAAANALDCCKTLVDSGANVNAIDRSFGDGRTPLIKAASQGNAGVVRLLLGASADRNVLDTDGKSAWDLATTEAIRCLIHPDKLVESTGEASDRVANEAKSHKNLAVSNAPEVSILRCSSCGNPSLFMRRNAGALQCSTCYQNAGET